MPRPSGHRLTSAARNAAIRMIQDLLAAGLTDAEVRREVAAKHDVSDKTVLLWLRQAYDGLANDVEGDRRHLVGLALKRRRIVMARSARDGDWATYLRAAESEAKLLGINAPQQTEHHVLIEKAQDLSSAVVDVVRDFFLDDPEGRRRFVFLLRKRMAKALTARTAGAPLVLDAEVTVKDCAGEAEP